MSTEALEAIVEDLRIWSGSLPAIVGVRARLWNGRELTRQEKAMALRAYTREGAQAAFEWLSEHAR